jgi:type I restriction enzyme S subunit
MWESATLEKVCNIYSGNSINAKKKAELYTGVNGVPYVATKDIGFDGIIDYENGVAIPQEDSVSFKVAPENTVFVCAEGGSAGRKIAISDRQVCFVNKLFALVAFKKLLPKFVYYYTISESFQSQFKDALTGLIGGVSLSKIKKFTINFPPIEEQKRIVAILDEAFEGVDQTNANIEQNINNARQIFKITLNDLFDCDEGSWENSTLNKVLSSQPRNGWSPPAIHHSDFGVPVLTLSSVTGFEFKPNEIKFTQAPTDNKRHYWVENGDLLITRSNTPQLVGHVAIASGIKIPTIYPDLIMRMKVNPQIVSTEFIYYQMQTSLLRDKITSMAHGANPTMKKITKSDVQSLPISYPSIDEQSRIIDKIKRLQSRTIDLEIIYQQKLTALKELKQSLLQKAFAGELTSDLSEAA